ncbi:CTP:molybdopterin cytidylyltransferase MocA [Roseovarius nanhaiticus]|uniref:CTP:molybdopterin cytidylyltransferase MocA n=1 Tax=Roseovarius nanhaiticus TaxID=573024 RepID=A0A1N7GBT0_9RHOB|nr:nucleotidyltransferase family protein [Roseovarius nanhaiticus]SEK31534.1 CTP:molybdopterin cytidylyltransferase MocA [Roseovarius nanhaiticus]SIS09978.1 CTP:molybdopterin cytidylyltransferase MocA [Roseovarius nanhaiticus]
MNVAILLPAAGASKRMRGADKLLEDVDGAPLLLRQTRRALATGAHVLVTTPAGRPARSAALAGTGAHLVPVKDPSEGIAASLRAGIGALPEGSTALIILLPDLPDIETEDLHKMMQAHASAPSRILRATAPDGTPGHPTLFPARFFKELSSLTGDSGAADLIRNVGFVPVPLDGSRAITDLDTPEAWAAWRARQR